MQLTNPRVQFSVGAVRLFAIANGCYTGVDSASMGLARGKQPYILPYSLALSMIFGWPWLS